MTDQPITPDAFATHEVFNQPPPLEDFNRYTSDAALQAAVEREGGGPARHSLAEFGALTGSADVMDLGRQANTYLPVLKAFDRFGQRADRVEFHPAYHRLMALSVAQGLHASPWDHLQQGLDAEPRPGAVVVRLAGTYLMTQVEAGHGCPITMTNAAVPALLMQPSLAQQWLPRILSREYDQRFLPAGQKRGVTLGMGMTEKQGGTDVRANTTRAVPAGSAGGEYRITGHKWFLSAPMCDAFLVLAQAPQGLACFLMPRFTPDGELNAIRIQRLKDKVGNRSNASSEVEFHAAAGWLIGEEGRGVRNIIEMATYTRLDCAVATAGMMRAVVAEAMHHCAHRTVFQKHLIDQPLMANVLADLVLETEAATALSFRLAGSFDRAHQDDDEAAFRRIMTPVAKYWVCKRAPNLAYEAMECLGGNGYVEEAIAGRIYREMPVNAIWEGSGNVMCLDVLRALQREPAAMDVVLAELELAAGTDARYDRSLQAFRGELADSEALEARSRRLVEWLAKLVSASLLLRHAPAAVGDAYCASRLGSDKVDAFGTLPVRADSRAIIARARPA